MPIMGERATPQADETPEYKETGAWAMLETHPDAGWDLAHNAFAAPGLLDTIYSPISRS